MYDSHLFVKELGSNGQKINYIPNTDEKYISFSKRVYEDVEIRFIGPFRLMPKKLETLTKI